MKKSAPFNNHNSVTKTSSKVREPKTYDEATSDGNTWRKAVDEDLCNLDAHQT